MWDIQYLHEGNDSEQDEDRDGGEMECPEADVPYCSNSSDSEDDVKPKRKRKKSQKKESQGGNGKQENFFSDLL